MVNLHALHDLTRIAFGRATMRWTQLGYGRTSSTSTSQQTPRNLFGFKDGTSNIKAGVPNFLGLESSLGKVLPGGFDPANAVSGPAFVSETFAAVCTVRFAVAAAALLPLFVCNAPAAIVLVTVPGVVLVTFAVIVQLPGAPPGIVASEA